MQLMLLKENMGEGLKQGKSTTEQLIAVVKIFSTIEYHIQDFLLG